MSSTEHRLNAPCAFIHLNNIQSNFDLVRSLAPGSRVMAVVKADAYGHGVLAVSEQLKSADALAVSRIGEGLELRSAGVELPIIVLTGFVNESESRLCRNFHLIPLVHSEYQLHLLKSSQLAWLKINSGMNRLGFDAMQAGRLADLIRQKNIFGLMSHLANADEPANVSNQSQIKRFLEISDQLGLDVDMSIANSAGVLGLDDSKMDWVRPGMMLYGGSPTGSVDSRLKAGMTLTAPILSINDVQAGDSIGYGSLWTAKEPGRVAVVGLGYADGYPREMPQGTPVLLDHKRRKLVGRVSMDMCFVELEKNDEVRAGDSAIFWGKGLPIDEIAQCAGTISLSLMSALTRRVQRIYQD
jgi:alanine racemase